MSQINWLHRLAFDYNGSRIKSKELLCVQIGPRDKGKELELSMPTVLRDCTPSVQNFICVASI